MQNQKRSAINKEVKEIVKRTPRTGHRIPWNLPISGWHNLANVWTMPIFSIFAQGRKCLEPPNIWNEPVFSQY